MKIEDIMSPEDWRLVRGISEQYMVSPYLIAAIGWHETHWGRLGAGRRGWHLGFGYYQGSKIKNKTKGLANQVRYAADFISRYLERPLNYEHLLRFSVERWQAGDPTAWAKSVWNIYLSIDKEEK